MIRARLICVYGGEKGGRGGAGGLSRCSDTCTGTVFFFFFLAWTVEWCRSFFFLVVSVVLLFCATAELLGEGIGALASRVCLVAPMLMMVAYMGLGF